MAIRVPVHDSDERMEAEPWDVKRSVLQRLILSEGARCGR